MAKRRVKIERGDVVHRFANRLRQLRLSLGISQVDLADRAGIAKSYLWRLENAETCPGIDLVQKLATALGTTASALLSSEDAADIEVLRDQARELAARVIKNATPDKLLLLNLLLARLR